MRVLTIPDVHLKSWMFDRARKLMLEGEADLAVCLMDLPDAFGKQKDRELYKKIYEAAISFAEDFPKTLWCMGNHDLSYKWERLQSGYSHFSADICRKGLEDLRDSLKNPMQMAYIHRVDNVLFLHGGLASEFVRTYLPYLYLYGTIDDVISEINNRFGEEEMWQDLSPLWYRPQYYNGPMFRTDQYVQVVGHTPVETISSSRGIISCDVFSTESDGTPFGSEMFPVIDSITGKIVRVLDGKGGAG